MSVLDQFLLKGKTALVTGAARGLGQALAVGLAEAGANVMLVDRQSMNETQLLIEQTGQQCQLLEIDLAEVKSIESEEIIDHCLSELGDLDILVNNAGIIRRKSTAEFLEEDWQTVIDINLNSVFYLCQAMGKYLLENQKKGKIINLASMLSFQGGYMVPSYTATKSALAGLTRSLANEWAQFGINVNAIAPGYFTTEVTAGIRVDKARNQAVLDRIPAGHYGNPDQLKGVVVFLASAASDYLQGAIIPVDGGWLAR